ncbi:MAG: hypothetical protein LBC79_04055 [Deltaproteobacteria bacterium]|jgi:hypothetical protein|nr:hypothetical protein [Deltaproteobacteria bacterium]
MNRYSAFIFLLLLCAPLAGCGTASPDGRLYSHAYQEEAPNKVPGHNLYRADTLDMSAAQRVNQFSRSEIIHEQHRTYVQRLTEAQALDKAAQKLGREPGSLFRQ